MQIVAAVSQRPQDGMTVRAIAKALSQEPEMIGHCVAIHLHLERRSEMLEIPPPADYLTPNPDDIITRALLLPQEQ